MRPAKVLIVLIIVFALIVSVRAGAPAIGNVVEAVGECLSGPGLYPVGTVVLLLMVLWGLGRMYRSSDDRDDYGDDDLSDRDASDDDPPDDPEYGEDDDQEDAYDTDDEEQ